MIKRHWLKGLLIGGLAMAIALAVLGGQAMAQEAPPEPPPPEELGLTGVPMSSDHFGLKWNVMASGGDESTSTHFKLTGTLGQPTVGNKSSTHYKSCTGFWCGVNKFMRYLYLPLNVKDY